MAYPHFIIPGTYANDAAAEAFAVALGWTIDVGWGYVNSADMTLRVCVATSPFVWKELVGVGDDHGLLGGLADDDHVEYTRLVGRAGGQVQIGGTGAGDDLEFQSTSHATKGEIFTDEYVRSARVYVNAQVDTYTPVLGDAGGIVTIDKATANTFNVPLNASVAFAVGTSIVVAQIGAGVTTIDAAIGVTLNGVNGGQAAINAQYSAVTLVKLASDTWLMFGNHGAVT